ncbi:MAG: hypothetical protein HFF50_08980 [Lawsonibacter sp.]|nr:hypothetical protein [Lawsonibacter sp.]
MSSVGSFGTFSTARLGIYAAQKGLSVTGNNITNINTPGYTRQRLNQSSFKSGAADRYQSRNDVHVGNGVFCDSVSQIRDPYLDIRYRTTSAEVGYNDQMLYGLNQIADILDEVGDGKDKDGIIHAQLNDIYDALTKLGVNAGQQEYDDIVKQKMGNLCDLFHKYATQLEALRKNTEDSLRTDINKVNDILTGIRDLNEAIRKSDIHGDAALEMRDDRNLLIDELSQYMKIDVVYSMEDIGAGRQVEKLTIKLADANPSTKIAGFDGSDEENAKNNDRAMLVDGVYCTQLTTPSANTDDTKINPDTGEPYKYLDVNGEPTDDPRKANQVFDDLYSITLGELRDSKDRVWKDEGRTTTTTVNQIPADYDPNKQPVITYEDGLKITTNTTYTANVDGTFTKTVVVDKNTRDIAMADNDIYGGLQATRELLTEEGEYASADDIGIDEKAATKRGIPYYQKSLDLLAQNFAKEFNKLNTQHIKSDSTLKAPDMTANPPDMSDYYDDADTIWVKIGDGDPKQYCIKDGYLVGIHDVDGGLCVMGGADRQYPIKVDDLKRVTGQDGTGQLELPDGTSVNGYTLPAAGSAPPAGVPATEAGMAYVIQNHGSSPEEFQTAVKDAMDNLGIKPGGDIPVVDVAGLFSNSGDSNDMTGITASNISISNAWSSQQAHVICRPEDPAFEKPNDYPEVADIPVDQTTQCENINHMLTLFDKKTLYNPQDLNAALGEANSSHQFEGSFQEYLNHIVSNLGGDQSGTDTKLNTYYQAAVDIDTSRASVSAVDLNDEAMNLMQYSKALNAAYRLMTTVDEALDRLINNTGVVGR